MTGAARAAVHLTREFAVGRVALGWTGCAEIELGESEPCASVGDTRRAHKGRNEKREREADGEQAAK